VLQSAALMPIALVLLVVGAFLGIALVLGRRQSRQDRRRIMADGVSGHAEITKIGRPSENGDCVIYFSVHSERGAIQGSQRTTQTAIKKLGLSVGSTAIARYLPQWPQFSFIDSLVLAERLRSQDTLSVAAGFERATMPALFYVTYAPGNKLRWVGGGDILIEDGVVSFRAQQRRPFWSKTIQRDFPLDRIFNVEQFDAFVRLELTDSESEVQKLQFRTVNASVAESLAKLLPGAKTATYTPQLAEGAAFNSALLSLTPTTPVTSALVALNVSVFLVATALGGGLLKSNPEVMIRLGTDYTPLTLSGQWWRLLTSIFLHFGLFHIALNMWALYVNGRVAERIFGSIRYLVIYLVAGLCGSLVSLLWHPIVNGAGASGAIFGILGSMLAFFLKREGGVPASVIKAQMTSVSVFVVYSLLYAARYQGIDNAAHLGGLLGGFVMGFILSRPLTLDRNARAWTLQWVTALVLTGGAATILAHFLATGALAPRAAHDANGDVIPRAALEPPLQALAGVSFNMTAAQVLKEKGQPIAQQNGALTYNAVDSRHDGVITVFFTHPNQVEQGPVFAIEFTGHDQTSAPAEMPYLNSLKTRDVIQKYGEPIATRVAPDGTKVLSFRNGVYVGTHDDTVYRYGIFDISRLRN
jgi:membrane associated rhomboid family serine protease